MRLIRFGDFRRLGSIALVLMFSGITGCASVATGDKALAPTRLVSLSDQIDERLEQGRLHKEAGRIEEAIVEYKAVLDMAPGNVDARNALAMLLAMNGDLEGAARELAQAVKDQPHVPWLMSNLGHVYILQGRKRDAQMMLTKALARDPSFEGARVNLQRADAMPDDDFQERQARLARDRLPPKSPLAKTRVRIVSAAAGEREARLLMDQLAQIGMHQVALDRPAAGARGRDTVAAQGIRVLFRRGFGEAALLIGRQLPGQPVLEPSRHAQGGDVRVVIGTDALTEFYRHLPAREAMIAKAGAPRSETRRSATRR